MNEYQEALKWFKSIHNVVGQEEYYQDLGLRFGQGLDESIEILQELINKVELIDNIVNWGKDKGIDKSNPKGQLGKLYEEVQEVEEAMNDNDLDEIQLELADVVIVDINMNTQYGLDFWETLEKGWNKIKDRKGRMVGDVWVKEEDL